MNKHGGELHYTMLRWGHFCLCTMRKHAYTYITCSKVLENLCRQEEILVLYNEVIMEIVHKEVSRVPSCCLGQPRLFEPAALVQQIPLDFSLKRHF